MNKTAQPVEVAYWNFQGEGEAIRLLLEYLRVPYKDTVYEYPSDRDRAEAEARSKNLAFRHLPYVIDGEQRACHLVSIMRYLGRKAALIATTETDRARTELLEQQLVDLRTTLHKVVYDPNCKELKHAFLGQLPAQLELLSKFMAHNAYSTGLSIVYVDFLCYDYLVKIKALVPEVLSPFHNLNQFIERIENLPRLVLYLKQNRKPKPLFSVDAKWNAVC